MCMKKERLIEIGTELFGEKWQAPLGRLLRLNQSTVWRWAKGRAPISEHTAMLLELFVSDPSLVQRFSSVEWYHLIDTTRERARLAVIIAVRMGLLEKHHCEQCEIRAGRPPKVQAHHDDYNRPLDVRWLCQKHHRGWHASNQAVDMRPDLSRMLPTELVELGARQHGLVVNEAKLKRWAKWRATYESKCPQEYY